MSQSIEKLALDLQSQVKTLAEEKSTYTERMKKMEDAMEAYRAKCDAMEATMKEYAAKMEAVMKATEDSESEEEVVDPNAPTPEPASKAVPEGNDLGGVNEEKMLEKMPAKEQTQERKREGEQASVTATIHNVANDEAPTPKAEEAPVQAVAEEAKPAPVAEAAPVVAQAVVEEAPAPKAEAVAPSVKAEIPAEILAKVAEVDSVKETLAKEIKVRDEALAQVGKMKADFESLLERIAKVESQELKAEKVIAKKVAEMAVEAVAAPASDEAVKTDEDILKEFNALSKSDPKAARVFYLKNESTIRAASWGGKKKA